MLKYETGKFSKKGMIVIPIEVRRHLKIEEGDKLEIIIDDDSNSATFHVVKKKSVFDVFGAIKSDKPFKPVNEIREAVMKDIVHERMNREYE